MASTASTTTTPLESSSASITAAETAKARADARMADFLLGEDFSMGPWVPEEIDLGPLLTDLDDPKALGSEVNTERESVEVDVEADVDDGCWSDDADDADDADEVDTFIRNFDKLLEQSELPYDEIVQARRQLQQFTTDAVSQWADAEAKGLVAGRFNFDAFYRIVQPSEVDTAVRSDAGSTEPDETDGSDA